jgi:transposase
VPALVHARKGKLMMGLINKTDPLDVHGLNRLQRAGTLPTVWVPPAELRDLRELARTRMVNARQRTRLKNRVTATLAKYGLRVQGASDAFGVKGREQMKALIQRLPPETLWNLRLLLKQLDLVERQIDGQERRMKALVKRTPEMERLMTLPGVAFILATVIALEVGVIERFADAEHLASYSGTTPRVHSSGGKTRYGPLRQDVNQYLKWAFAEAANAVAVHHLQWPDRHVSRLYRRLRKRKGHAKAVGAVARHVAEATWHVWSRGEDYRDPVLGRIRKG